MYIMSRHSLSSITNKAKGILKEVDGTVDMKDVFAAITDILGE